MILYLPIPVRDEGSDGWSDTTHESWVEVKTLHWGKYYAGNTAAKVPVQHRADRLRAAAQRKLHALDKRWHATADGHVGPVQGYFNERPYHGLVFGHFNETSTQVGKVLYAMAVHAEQTRALYMGGNTRVQRIAAVYSWLQRKLSNRVAKAQAQLLLKRLKFVAPTNVPIRHQGEAAALDLIVGQEADWRAAHDYRPLPDMW